MLDENGQVITGDTDPNDTGDGSGIKVVMSGQSYEVSQDVADAINTERQGMDRKLSENSEELGELRKYQRDTAGTQGYSKPDDPPKPAGYDYETAIYNDANAAISHLKNEIREEIRAEYIQDQTQRDSGNVFWNNFYAEHQDLGRTGIKAEVQARIMSELPKYSHLPDNATTRGKMADDARAYFLDIAKNFGVVKAEGTDNYSEGTSTGEAIIDMNSGVDTFKRPTTSELLKRSREIKRQALIDNK